VNGEVRLQEADPLPAARLGLLICFACLLLPWLNPYAGGPSTSVAPWLFSGLCVTLAWAIRPQAVPRAAVGVGLAGIAAWAVLRTGITPDTVALACACVLVFMAASVAAGQSEGLRFADVVALAWLAAAAVSTAIALVQYFGMADRFGSWISGSPANEAFANLRQRNQFASLTVVGMASLFWLAPRHLGRWPALAAMAWLAAGNAATTSRTGLVQMIALGFLACFWPGLRRGRAIIWAVGLLAYSLATLALPWLQELWTGVPASHLWDRVAAVDTCSSRKVLWANVLHLVAQKPWFGWGWGELDFAHYITLYDGQRFCDILDNAHNLPLHLAVELGLPAALVVLGGFIWAVALAKPWAEGDPARQMAWAVLAVIGMHSLVEYPLWYGPFQLAFGLCLGLLWPVRRQAAAPRHTVIGASAVLGMGLCAVCAYAAWDYWRVSQIYLPPAARAAAYLDDPLPEIRKSWLFGNQARFAELTITPLTRENAAWTFHTSVALLHYSPEPRVIEKVIESGSLLGRDDEALLHLARFRAAFPDAYAAWSQSQRKRASPAAP